MSFGSVCWSRMLCVTARMDDLGHFSRLKGSRLWMRCSTSLLLHMEEHLLIMLVREHVDPPVSSCSTWGGCLGTTWATTCWAPPLPYEIQTALILLGTQSKNTLFTSEEQWMSFSKRKRMILTFILSQKWTLNAEKETPRLRLGK